MDNQEVDKRLKIYLSDIKHSNSESGKAFLFLELVRDIFKETEVAHPHQLYPDLEHYIKSNKTVIIKGRADALLGNLIIEFESELSERKIVESEEQLRRYTAILWNNKGIIDYICIASDGLQFYVYRPRSTIEKNFSEDDIKLDRVDALSFDGQSSAFILKWLDRYVLYKALIPPTTEEIVEDFGPDSIAFKDSIHKLKETWCRVREDCWAMYSEWAKYLSIVYGSSVDSEELFLKHTYLATLAKLMVYSYYSKGIAPSSDDEIEKILRGGVFKRWGIENFLEEDFFVWIIKTSTKNLGILIASKLIDFLDRYDLTKMNEDVLKGLYQQLVDPADRHDLGEFYTPDWLAQKIVMEIVTDANAKVLDPACGSGTFLVASIRQKTKLLNLERSDKLNLIIDTVYGIDVHPLAVLISKANYLMSLGDLIKYKRNPIFIPVYMADSILYPHPILDIAHGIEVYLYPAGSNRKFVIPREVIEKEMMDKTIDLTVDLAYELLKVSTNDDQKYLGELVRIRLSLSEEASNIIVENIKLLKELIFSNKDSIYPFILKNVYKPSILEKVDYVIGNPPWLTYHDVRSIDRQKELKNLMVKEYHLVDTDKEELVMHMEMATLFLIRCSDVYLKQKGVIGFVMPISLFAADHHHNLRNNTVTKVTLGIQRLFDLEKVTPVFSLASCVVIAKKGEKTHYPIRTTKFQGKLKRKNLQWSEINEAIKQKRVKELESEIRLLRLGARSDWIYGEKNTLEGNVIAERNSFYLSKFKEGATLVPRPFWFIDIQKHELFGFDHIQPYLETSRRAMAMTKQKWKGITIKGKVEREYLFATLLASDILPFSHLAFRLVVLPVLRTDNSLKVIDDLKVKSKGDLGMYTWLIKAMKYWKNVRNEKAEKMNIYQRLDRNRGIIDQIPSKRYYVLFSAVGTYLCSCVVDTKKSQVLAQNGFDATPSGFMADYSSIYFQTSNSDEAYYLSSVLNSSIVDSLIKPFQAKGLWGERNVWKKPLELPIPEFDKDNPTHKALSQVAQKYEKMCQKIYPGLLAKYKIDQAMITPNQTGKLRTEIREILQKEISLIDKSVSMILKPTGKDKVEEIATSGF